MRVLKKFLLNAGLLLFSLVLALTVAEIAVRQFKPQKGLYHRLPDTPCITIVPNLFEEQNNHGFHGPEFSIRKPENKFRIVVLGDSQTWGNPENHALTYPAQLEAFLHKQGRAEIEVINLGVPGTTTADHLCLFEHYVPQLEPDLVLLGVFLGNDVEESGEDNSWTFSRNQWRRRSWQDGQRSALRQKLENVLFKSQLVTFLFDPNLGAKPEKEDPRFWGAGFIAMRAIVENSIKGFEKDHIGLEELRVVLCRLYHSLEGGLPESFECPEALVDSLTALEENKPETDVFRDEVVALFTKRLTEVRNEHPEWTVGKNPLVLLWDEQQMSEIYAPPSPLFQSRWHEVFDSLSQMRELAVEGGTPLQLLLIPTRAQSDPYFSTLVQNYLLDEAPPSVTYVEAPHRKLSEWCQKHDIPCLDLMPIFRQEKEPGSLYIPLDIHLSPAGNQLIAQWTGERLLQNGGITSPR